MCNVNGKSYRKVPSCARSNDPNCCDVTLKHTGCTHGESGYYTDASESLLSKPCEGPCWARLR